jgi:hypothetical protein
VTTLVGMATIRYVITEHLEYTPSEIFDVVVVRQPENHPRWEPEVIELRREGPAVAGARAMMVRKDWGKVREVPVEYLEVVEDRRVRFASDGAGVRFDLSLDLEPVGTGTDVRGTIEVTLTGGMRWLRPLLARAFRKNSERIMKRLSNVMSENAVT